VLKGLIDGLTSASQVEAEVGTDNTKVMTPLRVKQSITSELGTGANDIPINSTVDDKITTALQSSVGDIRYSKLSNPLVHLFKKNKLVDTLSGNLSWTRDSGKTYIDRTGVLRYSPSPYATNLCLHSENFGDATWVKSITVGTSTILHNNVKLQELTDDSSTTFRYLQQSLTLNKGYYTISSLVSIGTCNYARFGILNAGVSILPHFDLINKSMVVIPTGTISPKIETRSPTVSRISFTFYVAADATNVDVRCYGATGVTSVVSDVGSVYYGGIQLEKSMVANGYVKTTTASVTGKSSLPVYQAVEEEKGWLIEQSRTNTTRDSKFQLVGAHWVINGTPTVGMNSAVAPDGTSRAVKITTSASGAGLSQSSAHATLTDVASIYLKGEIGGEVVAFGFGTDRKQVTLTTEWELYEYKGNGTGTTTFTLYAGTSNSTIFYASDAQSESISSSSRIPTEATSVTRARDVVSVPFENNHPSLLDFTKQFSYSLNLNFNSNGVQQEIIGYTSEQDFKYSMVRFNTTDALYYYRSGLPSMLGGDGNMSIAVSYIGDNLTNCYRDGLLTDSDVSVPVTASANPLSIPIGYSLYGHINDFRIYDFALNAAEVAFLAGE